MPRIHRVVLWGLEVSISSFNGDRDFLLFMHRLENHIYHFNHDFSFENGLKILPKGLDCLLNYK